MQPTIKCGYVKWYNCGRGFMQCNDGSPDIYIPDKVVSLDMGLQPRTYIEVEVSTKRTGRCFSVKRICFVDNEYQFYIEQGLVKWYCKDRGYGFLTILGKDARIGRHIVRDEKLYKGDLVTVKIKKTFEDHECDEVIDLIHIDPLYKYVNTDDKVLGDIRKDYVPVGLENRLLRVAICIYFF